MNKRYTMLVVLVVMLSAAMSVEAAVQTTSIRNSESASASWSQENMGSTVVTSMFVDKTSSGTSISVNICTNSGNQPPVPPPFPQPPPCKFGGTFTMDKVFDMTGLDSATLSPVKIDLFDFNTGTVETITIKAKWAGVGKITSSQFFSRSSNDFNTIFTDSSERRNAVATGTINDLDLGTSEFASLAMFKSIQISSQK